MFRKDAFLAKTGAGSFRFWSDLEKGSLYIVWGSRSQESSYEHEPVLCKF